MAVLGRCGCAVALTFNVVMCTCCVCAVAAAVAAAEGDGGESDAKRPRLEGGRSARPEATPMEMAESLCYLCEARSKPH